MKLIFEFFDYQNLDLINTDSSTKRIHPDWLLENHIAKPYAEVADLFPKLLQSDATEVPMQNGNTLPKLVENPVVQQSFPPSYTTRPAQPSVDELASLPHRLYSPPSWNQNDQKKIETKGCAVSTSDPIEKVKNNWLFTEISGQLLDSNDENPKERADRIEREKERRENLEKEIYPLSNKLVDCHTAASSRFYFYFFLKC